MRAFLMSRRAKITPVQAGLQTSGSRRVTGLRRNEVAMLADVSVEYYAKIERGNLSGVSDGVLEAVARALQLDDAEREHLFDLARIAHGASEPVRRRKPKMWVPRPSLLRALDVITYGPAFVRNGRMDILATNPLGAAFYDYVFDGPGQGNLARFNFLDERSHDFYPDWEAAADISVAILRTEAGRDPRDKQLHDLIGELSTRSDAFRTRWGAHNVRRHGAGTKSFHHHVVGDLRLSYEGLELTAEPGLSFLIYTAEPGSESQERLNLLASWAATAHHGRVDPRRAGVDLNTAGKHPQDTVGTKGSPEGRHRQAGQTQQEETLMPERTAVIASASGLHARPASIFTEAASRLDIDVTIARHGTPTDEAMDAASILSLMSLGAKKGDTIVLRAEGPGAEDALERLAALIETDLDAN